jgi:hypothetical protein
MTLPLYSSAEEIQVMRPDVNDAMLSQDIAAVQSSRLSIRRIYLEKGFNASEADSALLYGWKQLRLKVLTPTTALSSESLVNYVSGFGKLIIKTTPVGAAVQLDYDNLSQLTNAVAWPSAGTYRIKLSLDGYKPIEDTCEVQEGKPTLFERTLKPVKKKRESPVKSNRPK